MREIKKRAEYLLIEGRGSLKREMLLMRARLFGILICLGVLAASLVPGEFYFYGIYFGRKILTLPALSGVLVLSYFYFSERLYFTGRLFYLTGECKEEPGSFIRFATVLRYALLVISERAAGFLWLSFFLLPSRLTAIIIVRTFSETGNMQRIMFFTLIAAFLLLTAIGLAFYFYLSGRYFLSELLFIRCPGQRASEIMKSSALLTRDSLGKILIFRAGSLFGKRGVTKKMRAALFRSDLFSDRDFYKNYGLVRPFTFREQT